MTPSCRLLRLAAGWGAPALRLLATCAFLGSSDAWADTNSAALPTYQRVVLETPRPIVVHVAAVDLASGAWEVTAVIALDPDGKGPAQSQLADPLTLAESAGVQVAINANSFSRLPGNPTDTPLEAGLPVILGGLAVRHGEVFSRPRTTPNTAFWIDDDGKPHIGQPAASERPREGVAGFGWLVREGQSTITEDSPIHPRTAVAFDRDSRTLWMVVVDGRQPGVSEGMTLRELADFVRTLGAWSALNLDGGGSSVLMLRDGRGRLRVANRPATVGFFGRVTRPVPVLLGVRPKSTPR